MATNTIAGSLVPNALRRGRVGALVQTPDGKFGAVTAARVLGDPFKASAGKTLRSSDLLLALPVRSATGGKCQPRSIIPPHLALGEPVFRYSDSSVRLPGRVVALHGRIAVFNSDPPTFVRDLLSVEFAQSDERSAQSALPLVEADDLGTLVMTYDGAGVGLIVGGGGNTALVASLHEFIALKKSTLLPSEFDSANVDVGLDYMFNDLRGIEPLDLGEVPEAA